MESNLTEMKDYYNEYKKYFDYIREKEQNVK